MDEYAPHADPDPPGENRSLHVCGFDVQVTDPFPGSSGCDAVGKNVGYPYSVYENRKSQMRWPVPNLEKLMLMEEYFQWKRETAGRL